MGRLRKTEAQRRAERFGELYRVGKARSGLTEELVGNMLGMRRPALLARRNSPDKFSVGELALLGKAFGWSDDEFLSIIRVEQ